MEQSTKTVRFTFVLLFSLARNNELFLNVFEFLPTRSITNPASHPFAVFELKNNKTKMTKNQK